MENDSGPSNSSNNTLDDRVIQIGHNVLIRLPSGEVRSVKIETKAAEKSINLGKYGSFRMNALVGQPYGLSYEVHTDKSLTVLPPKTLQELEETGATNELIVDAGLEVQPLTGVEIEAMKKAGVHASDIIKMQIEGHVNYELKTEYSKEKYRKRKQAKFAKEITVLEPSLFNVAAYWFAKDPARIREVRIDTLAQLLSFANVRPGASYIVVDETAGLLSAAVMERLGGTGRLMFITDQDSHPQLAAVTLMNFRQEVSNQLRWLNWAAVDEDYVPIRPPTEVALAKSDGQRERMLRRKAFADTTDNARQELFAGEWDGLLLATSMDPYSVVEALSPYLAGSAQIVVYHQHLQILCDLQSKMRPQPCYLAPALTEAWLRQYQVLPGRTHPMMNMSGGGGYLLQATYVYDEPKANSALAGFRQRRKQRKLEIQSAGKAEEQDSASEIEEELQADEPDAMIIS